MFLCHFKNDTSCRNELLHCILALLEWLIKLMQCGNSDHFNALAEWFNLCFIHRNTHGCFKFAVDSTTCANSWFGELRNYNINTIMIYRFINTLGMYMFKACERSNLWVADQVADHVPFPISPLLYLSPVQTSSSIHVSWLLPH